jgi:hypothetical protein
MSELWDKILPLVRDRVRGPFCPCRVGVPYFDRDDPVLLIYVEYVTGEETILAVRRLFTGLPVLHRTPTFYNRYDPADRALMTRLKRRLVQRLVIQ